jgi:hypothetical protein
MLGLSIIHEALIASVSLEGKHSARHIVPFSFKINSFTLLLVLDKIRQAGYAGSRKVNNPSFYSARITTSYESEFYVQ